MQPLWLSFHADQADPTRNTLHCTREQPNGVRWEAAAWLLSLLLLVMLSQHCKRPGQGSPKGQHMARIMLPQKGTRNKILGNKSTLSSLSQRKISPAYLQSGCQKKSRISFLLFSGASSFPVFFTPPPKESHFPGLFTVVFPGPELGFDIPRRSASMSSISWKARRRGWEQGECC